MKSNGYFEEGDIVAHRMREVGLKAPDNVFMGGVVTETAYLHNVGGSGNDRQLCRVKDDRGCGGWYLAVDLRSTAPAHTVNAHAGDTVRIITPTGDIMIEVPK
jgi:hypothetical protein